MKTYLTPLAIIIGSIIISVGLYLAITSEERAKFKFCVETYSSPEDSLEETKQLCKELRQYGNL